MYSIYIYISSINIYYCVIVLLLIYFFFVLYIPCASKTLWKGLWRKDIMRRIMGPLNREACLLQGFKMCTAKRHIILFAIFTKSWSETENNKIFWCKKKCTISDLTMDQPWTNRGTTYLGRGTACGQGYESFQLISFFLLQPNFGSSPKKGQQIGFQSGYSWRRKNSKTESFKAMKYPWSLFRSFLTVHV